jgi:hypothetical protein
MATRAEQIRAQKTLFDAFRKHTLHVKFWSKAMLTPLELELIFKKQDKYEKALQIIASTDVLRSGEIAREALGLSEGPSEME